MKCSGLTFQNETSAAVLLRSVITLAAFYKMKFGILLYFEFHLFWKK